MQQEESQRSPPEGFKTISEGLASILVPDTKEADVFYNPIQEFNRDMSIAVINTWCQVYQDELAEKQREKQRKKQAKLAAAAKENNSNETEEEAIKNGEEEATKNGEEEQAESIPVQPRIRVLEALSATGLRAIRYAKECPNVSSILANDMDSSAVAAINRNVTFNNVEGKVIGNQGDANLVMYQGLTNEASSGKGQFHIIDLDPYGTAAPFLDAAVRSVQDGGLLCVTCTDMASLAGGQLEACWVKYGSMPVPNSSYCHEMGLRILLHTIQTSAARYKRVITPLLSCSIDFYVRVFVRVSVSPALTKKTPARTSIIYSCTGCKEFKVLPMGHHLEAGKSTKFKVSTGPPVGTECKNCGSRFHIGGPFFSDPIHDQGFVEKLRSHVKASEAEKKYKTFQRMLGMITVISEELKDVPFYYLLPSICGLLHCQTPTIKSFCSAIMNAGYRVSLSHCTASSIKTDAPIDVLFDILRTWVKDHPVDPKKLKEGSLAAKILGKEPSIEVSFEKNEKEMNKGENREKGEKVKLVRYQVNPEKFWGPKARPKGGKRKTDDADKVETSKKNKIE
ncbi:tRNA methyltransferase 1 [Chytridiales sp. JEL 0842]|nr:tRNA methyltransferase 1 [Chytridiales sp. JEL 0842]